MVQMRNHEAVFVCNQVRERSSSCCCPHASDHETQARLAHLSFYFWGRTMVSIPRVISAETTIGREPGPRDKPAPTAGDVLKIAVLGKYMGEFRNADGRRRAGCRAIVLKQVHKGNVGEPR